MHTEDSPDWVEELLQDAEPLDGGMTNKVWDTGDTVLKEYNGDPVMSRALTLYKSFLHGEPVDVSGPRRVENERKAEEYFEGRGIGTADILRSEGRFMEFEKIDGASFSDAVETMEIENIYNVALKVGESTREMHQNGVARRDHRAENLLVNFEDGEYELNWIDNEYFTNNATEADKSMDVITFLSEVKGYSGFASYFAAKGFKDGYGLAIGLKENLFATATSIVPRDRLEAAAEAVDTRRNAYDW